ncbi:chondroitin sulfate N-acetylgalactosaminyltransferase 2-like [Ischnura elegans]|uniref:chondroitin sulfate N-acetylgalactosaminyltransferase 2-like n=1 Tax=Ischnura elegans TaxID=197161 RepID=UPI001ED8974C|nr:chondroitin sulfate N-acetylgalactosaminyltransferase 2-like [Ischnura elegans]XP_046392466.1 chondroitin sulfate N-acetylgalactosaminyltransferase 2-like [Ischnura elegans]
MRMVLLLRRGGVAGAVVRGMAGGVVRGGPRLLSRLLLIACSASLLSLLFIGRCGLKQGIDDDNAEDAASAPPPAPGGYIESLADPGADHAAGGLRAEVGRLNAQVRALKGQLLRAKRWRNRPQDAGPSEPRNSREGTNGDESLLSRHPASLSDPPWMINGSGDPGEGPAPEIECESGAAEAARKSEAWPGSAAWAQGSEYEVIPFTHFSLSRLHPPELGMGRRVVEKPLGFRRKDLIDAALAALHILNTSPSLHHLSLEDFLEGAYRTEPTSGTHYELFFRVARGPSPPPIARVTLLRPFAPLRPAGPAEVRPPRPVVNVVLPLPSKCPQSVFEAFMDKFARIAIRNDRKVTLTVAHFGGGGAGLAAARRVMVRVSKDTRFRGLRLLALNTTTSRAAALHAAVEACCTQQGNGGHQPQQENSVAHQVTDPLLFLTDVDAVFSARFLDRCRWHASPGRKVYYPIAFGLFNPRVVYSLQGRAVPPEADRLLVSRDTGSWRDSLFSLSCQHRSDFLRESETEDGGPAEDVTLYRRHVKSSRVRVIRSTDPGLFLLWRRRPCPSAPPNATPAHIERLRACRRARALTEGSHAQLGLLAFRDGDEPDGSVAAEFPRTTDPPPARKETQPPPAAVNASSGHRGPAVASPVVAERMTVVVAEEVGGLVEAGVEDKVGATKEETRR